MNRGIFIQQTSKSYSADTDNISDTKGLVMQNRSFLITRLSINAFPFADPYHLIGPLVHFFNDEKQTKKIILHCVKLWKDRPSTNPSAADNFQSREMFS